MDFNVDIFRKFENLSLSDFKRIAPEVFAYDSGREKLGFNESKLCIVFSGDSEVASIVFIDHLYVNGRIINVPALDLVVESDDGLTSRLSVHLKIEEIISAKLGMNNLESKYTEPSPHSKMYWDINSKVEIDELPISSVYTTRKNVGETQLIFDL